MSPLSIFFNKELIISCFHIQYPPPLLFESTSIYLFRKSLSKSSGPSEITLSKNHFL